MNTAIKPTFEGIFARAWQLDVAALVTKHQLNPAQVATVAAWIIHAPMSHPIWPWYRLALIHLRPIPNVDPPIMYKEGATHEFVLQALNPEHCPPALDDIPQHVLTPANFACQIVAPNDAEAMREIETRAVIPIVHGHLSPDTDWTSVWVQIFNDSMLRK